jgi:hypothetical protein
VGAAQQLLRSLSTLQVSNAAETHQARPKGDGRKLNAWTQWGTLKEVVVGVADNACFPPEQPAMVPEINDPQLASALGGAWPKGRKSPACISAANAELNNLVNVLEGEGVRTLRPEVMDWSQPVQTPHFKVDNQYVACCIRDTVITVGNTAIEAPMSRRDRYHEVEALRKILRDLWREDPGMLWKAAPKPSMADHMYDQSWWNWTLDERREHMHKYQYCITNEEPCFDAADITRCGKDIFVQTSMTSNYAGTITTITVTFTTLAPIPTTGITTTSSIATPPPLPLPPAWQIPPLPPPLALVSAAPPPLSSPPPLHHRHRHHLH